MINDNRKWSDQHSEEISRWMKENLESEEEEKEVEEEKSAQSEMKKILTTASPALFSHT